MWEKGFFELCSKVVEKSILDSYESKTKSRNEWFYDGSLGSELLFKAKSKSLEVYARVYIWKNEGRKICKLCNEKVESMKEREG